MKGRKIRSAASYTIKGTIEALGANATPIPWPDTFMAIQQKTVEGCTAPTGTLVESRLYEVINNITEAQHLFEPMSSGSGMKTSEKCPGPAKNRLRFGSRSL